MAADMERSAPKVAIELLIIRWVLSVKLDNFAEGRQLDTKAEKVRRNGRAHSTHRNQGIGLSIQRRCPPREIGLKIRYRIRWLERKAPRNQDRKQDTHHEGTHGACKPIST